MSYHHQNLSDGKLPLWRHGRAWWLKIGWEWLIFMCWSMEFGIALSKRSFSIRLPGFRFYLYARDDEDFEPAEFEIAYHDGILWLTHPWMRNDGSWVSADPWWKRKPLALHVVDWLIGKSRCTHTKGSSFQAVVPMPEGSYLATATPETYVWRRRWYWPTRRRDSVSLSIPGGIPFAGKGESEWNCGDDGLQGVSGSTTEDAIANAVRSVLEARRKHGYDAKGTGKAALTVLNQA